MIFKETKIEGAYLLEPERIEDRRGFFARTFCKREFAARGIDVEFVQNNISYNKKRGTLRGMHYQVAPHEEVKLVSCISGAVYDVLLDIRKESLSYGIWIAVELTAENNTSLYIPAGIAHGFQTLKDHSTLLYHMGDYYCSEAARVIRWDDDRFQIKWPVLEKIVSEKDSQKYVG